MTDGMSTDVIPAVPQTDDNLDLPRALNGYSRPETERLVADLRARNRRQTDQIQDLKRMVDGLTRENATLNGRVRDMTDAATRTDGELALARRENGALQEKVTNLKAENDTLRREREQPLAAWGERLQSVMDQAKREADANLGKARQQADRLIADATAKAETLGADARRHADTLIGDAQEKAAAITKDAEQRLIRAREQADAARRDAETRAAQAEERRQRVLDGLKAALEELR